MKEILKNVINRGGNDLTMILCKIDTLWAEGKLTDEERAELTELARSRAETEYSVDVLAKLTELEQRVKALEGAESSEEYPVYTTGRWYYSGDKISFEDKQYTCTAPAGTVCVWSPKDYPDYWEEVKES